MKIAMFYDMQTGGFSHHVTIDGLSEMLIEDWLQVVGSDESYEGEFEHEKEKWKNATERMKRDIIESYEYEIIENPTDEDIARWEGYTGYKWQEEVAYEIKRA